MTPADELERGASALGIPLTVLQRDRMLQYVALISKWNRVYNLTAIRENEKAVTYHLLDSLSILPHLGAEVILDIGTGAGLPGIPLALAAPNLRITLLDSNHKKGSFLRQARLELGLENVDVVVERAETYQPSVRFGAAVSRAFSDLGTFIQAAAPLILPNGRLLAMKGVYPNEELEQVPSGVRVEKVVRLSVPGLDAERHLVVLLPSASAAAP